MASEFNDEKGCLRRGEDRPYALWKATISRSLVHTFCRVGVGKQAQPRNSSYHALGVFPKNFATNPSPITLW